MTYRELTLKYIEVVEEVQGSNAAIQELKDAGEVVPNSLRITYENYFFQQMTLLTEGLKHGKKHTDMYKDGWDFWFEEDKQLREMRYGSK